MPHKQTSAYISCTCAKGNQGPSSWGALIVDGVSADVHLHGADASATGPVMALEAALAVASALPLDRSAIVYIDNSYVARGINQWRTTWEKRFWRSSEGTIIANYRLWKALFEALDARPLVRVEWVRGAEQFEGMEAARRLAAPQPVS